MYQMDEKTVSSLNPDVIFRIYDSPPDTVKPYLDANDAQLASGDWSHMNAAKNGMVFTLPQAGFAANPGASMADSLEALAHLAFGLGE
jgi:ABC-type Fe3+-hydroxamate transport system substrate-binding protein